MNTKPLSILLVIFAIFILQNPAFPKNTDGEWYQFSIPEKLDQSSPLNIGKLVLDPPSGKHGFVTVKDGHFYFEDGTRAKFWGTNLCFSACFPDKKDAEMLAERIAFFGFNSVRLHHMDFYFEPRGIFEDICPAYKNSQMKETGHLSPRQLDKLDYLIYQLKLRGIYIDMNLLVARHFTEADGVKDAASLGMAAKPFSMFDSRLIELQKQYAKDLLTHYNPYTKMRYCDDPAIAMVEIINETSVFDLKKVNVPDYYKSELDNLSKECPEPENFYLWLETKYLTEMREFLRKDIGIKAPIGVGGHWDPGSLKAQASACDFVDAHAYWDHPKFPHKSWDTNDFTINNNSIFQKDGLGIVGELSKKQAKDKPFTVTEWNHCYPNQYAYETPVILAATAQTNDWDALFQFAFSHGWDRDPKFDDIHSYFDTIGNAQKLILTGLGGLIFLKDDPVKIEVKKDYYMVDSPSVSAACGAIKKLPLAMKGIDIISNGNGCAAVWTADDTRNDLITIGEIKNKNSGWGSDVKFDWGSGPTFLRKLGVVKKKSSS